MTETTVGREPIQIVELRQPLCSRTFGVAPCMAVGGADVKCYNTRVTCKDAANFALGAPLSLFFSNGRVAERFVAGAPYILPTLRSVSTAPTRINLAGANSDATGLGNGTVCTIVIDDTPHTDRRVDPYVNERPWDPLDAEARGSFWSRWLARNPYRQTIEVIIYEGYAGQALADMVRRRLFLEEITGPMSGQVTLRCKDILARLEGRKAQAPAASPGVLVANVTTSATTFDASNCTIADYPSSGVLRINDEIMGYSGRTAIAGGVRFTGVGRSAANTVARAHNAGDTVQRCLVYQSARVDNIVYELLVDFAGVDPTWLDFTGWVDEVNEHLSLVLLDALITAPTPVTQLIGDLCTQAQFNIWWDERVALVRLRAIRGLTALPVLLTDESHILAGSFSLTEKPRERASQVWVYFGRQDFVRNVNEPASYRGLSVTADFNSESADQYGEASIRQIFGYWLSSRALADTTGSKISTRYRVTPTQCVFQLDAKDRNVWVGDTVRISHYLDRDDYGNRRVRNWTIISAEEVVPGEVVEYTAEDTTLYGRVSFIMAAGSPDYPGAALVPFRSAYIGNAAGLLSDGAPCARIN